MPNLDRDVILSWTLKPILNPHKALKTCGYPSLISQLVWKKQLLEILPLCLSSIQGMACSRLRSNGQSPLSLRTPVKAVTPVGSMAAGRQPSRGLPVVQAPSAGGGRRVQSPGSANGGGYIPGRASTGVGRSAVGRGQAVPSASTRSKLSQPPRRWVLKWKAIKQCWDIEEYVLFNNRNFFFMPFMITIWFWMKTSCFIDRSLGMTKMSDESWKDGCYWV